MPRIAVIPGDGIGTEVTREATRVLERATALFGLDLALDEWDLGAERFLRDGVTITEEEFRTLAEDRDAVLLGALGDPRVPDQAHVRDILLGLRFRLDLYINFRPCVLPDPSLSPLKEVPPEGIRLEIFRENTEGIYVNLGGVLRAGTPDEVAIQESVNTRKGVERIVRAAFQYARDRGRPSVTLVDKANAMPIEGSLWRRVFEDVAGDYPEVTRSTMYVDAMEMDLVRRPERYSVLVTSNLFGDIISDLAAELTGGLGLAPSANIHPGRHALFEPVHGSAPDIAGTGTANPIGAIRCAGLLLDHFGYGEAASAVEAAVGRSIAQRQTTADLGGKRSTAQVGEWICDNLDATRRSAQPA